MSNRHRIHMLASLWSSRMPFYRPWQWHHLHRCVNNVSNACDNEISNFNCSPVHRIRRHNGHTDLQLFWYFFLVGDRWLQSCQQQQRTCISVGWRE